MDNFHKFVVEELEHRPKPEKPLKNCWGCGAVDEKKSFKICPKCKDFNVIPACFCSDKCFKENWKRQGAGVQIYEDSVLKDLWRKRMSNYAASSRRSYSD